MRKFGWASLCMAGVLACAASARAAVVYSQTGLTAPCIHAPCAPTDFLAGVAPYSFSGGPYEPPGTYHYELTIDASAFSTWASQLSTYDIWNEYVNGVYDWGEDEGPYLSPDTTFHATATGFAGDFTTQPWTDLVSGPSERTDQYFTGVSITAAPLTEERFAYTFTITSIPEPATWALMGTGCGLLGSMLRRRRAGAGGGRVELLGG
jgi:hypothetical protein